MSTLEDIERIRPVDPELSAKYRAEMEEAIRTYRLRELREERAGLTQVEVAREANLSQARVSDIERGDIDKMELGTIRRYAEALGMDVEINLVSTGVSYQLA